MTTPHSNPASWKKLGSSSLATTRIFDLRGVRYQHPRTGQERDFAVIAAPDWVNVIALTPDGHVVLVNQFRYGIDTHSIELPGGVIDAGEDPLVAGMRELREETGYVGTGPRLLGSVHPNPAFLDNRCHIAFVEAAICSSPTAWDHDEDLVVLTAPVEEVFAWARSGKITHSLVLNALWLFEPLWRQRAGRSV